MRTAFGFEEEPSEFYSELDEEQAEFDEEAFDAELADFEWEEEFRRGRRSPVRATMRGRQPVRRRPPVLSRPRPPKRPPPRPSHPRRPVIIGRRIVREPAPCICPAHGTEFVRWVQSSLNQVLGLNLSVDGVMNAPTRSALRRFQEQQGLPVDGIAGPETERALIEAKTSQPSQARESPESGEFEDFDLGEIEWEGEVNRRNPDYVRWVRRSLKL